MGEKRAGSKRQHLPHRRNFHEQSIWERSGEVRRNVQRGQACWPWSELGREKLARVADTKLRLWMRRHYVRLMPLLTLVTDITDFACGSLTQLSFSLMIWGLRRACMHGCPAYSVSSTTTVEAGLSSLASSDQHFACTRRHDSFFWNK